MKQAPIFSSIAFNYTPLGSTKHLVRTLKVDWKRKDSVLKSIPAVKWIVHLKYLKEYRSEKLD
jgi:hypothetical protein